MTGDTAVETERLILRTWREEDRDAYERQCNTPTVMRHLGGVQSSDACQAGIDRMNALHATEGFGFWCVERRADQRVLGFCGIKLVNAENAPIPGEYEVGWRFREDAWGQGYAKEAAIASLHFAFDKLGAERVVAFTTQANAASWGLMRRLGMMRREDLDFVDPKFGADNNPTIVHVIARNDFTASQATPAAR